jgi:hypothetical protein
VAAVEHAARRMERCLEVLLLVGRAGGLRLAAPAAPSVGVAVVFTGEAGSAIGESTERDLRLPLPPPGVYAGGAAEGLQALARESLLVAWEALALKWQSRHAVRATPWAELAWLRRALEVDPACEPVTMRLIAVAESLARL